MGVTFAAVNQRPTGATHRSAISGPTTVVKSARPQIRRILESPLQRKLTVGPPNDAYEQEADRVADAVMRMPDADAHDAPVQRMCAECEEEEQGIRRRPAGHAGDDIPRVTPEVASGIGALAGGGQPLPESARAFFEPRFGRDFGDVRIHADARAGTLARSVNARAFTLGSDVAFAAGAYLPESAAGRELLAHELTHVVQQSDATAATLQRRAVPASIGGVTMTKETSVVDANLKDVVSNALDAVITTPLGGVQLDAIFVSSVNDGTHDSDSRHYSDLAIDMSRVKTAGATEWQFMSSDYPSNTNVKAVVEALQNGFEGQVGTPGVRENFGPYIKKKNGSDHSVGGHGDHIHISGNE